MSESSPLLCRFALLRPGTWMERVLEMAKKANEQHPELDEWQWRLLLMAPRLLGEDGDSPTVPCAGCGMRLTSGEQAMGLFGLFPVEGVDPIFGLVCVGCGVGDPMEVGDRVINFLETVGSRPGRAVCTVPGHA